MRNFLSFRKSGKNPRRKIGTIPAKYYTAVLGVVLFNIFFLFLQFHLQFRNKKTIFFQIYHLLSRSCCHRLSTFSLNLWSRPSYNYYSSRSNRLGPGKILSALPARKKSECRITHRIVPRPTRTRKLENFNP